MVAVVVDHSDAALDAAHLKAPVDAGKQLQALANRVYRDLEFQADGHGRGRIQHVVRARHVQRKQPRSRPRRFQT